MTRERLPQRRRKISECIAHGAERYGAAFTYDVQAGLYPDGRVGEVFIRPAVKSGTFIAELFNGAAILMSLALQHGATIEDIAHSLGRFERGDRTSPLGMVADWCAMLADPPQCPPAEQGEPCQSSGSRTVLRAPGGETPPGD